MKRSNTSSAPGIPLPLTYSWSNSSSALRFAASSMPATSARCASCAAFCFLLSFGRERNSVWVERYWAGYEDTVDQAVRVSGDGHQQCSAVSPAKTSVRTRVRRWPRAVLGIVVVAVGVIVRCRLLVQCEVARLLGEVVDGRVCRRGGGSRRCRSKGVGRGKGIGRRSRSRRCERVEGCRRRRSSSARCEWVESGGRRGLARAGGSSSSGLSLGGLLCGPPLVSRRKAVVSDDRRERSQAVQTERGFWKQGIALMSTEQKREKDETVRGGRTSPSCCRRPRPGSQRGRSQKRKRPGRRRCPRAARTAGEAARSAGHTSGRPLPSPGLERPAASGGTLAGLRAARRKRRRGQPHTRSSRRAGQA